MIPERERKAGLLLLLLLHRPQEVPQRDRGSSERPRVVFAAVNQSLICLAEGDSKALISKPSSMAR